MLKQTWVKNEWGKLSFQTSASMKLNIDFKKNIPSEFSFEFKNSTDRFLSLQLYVQIKLLFGLVLAAIAFLS